MRMFFTNLNSDQLVIALIQNYFIWIFLHFITNLRKITLLQLKVYFNSLTYNQYFSNVWRILHTCSQCCFFVSKYTKMSFRYICLSVIHTFLWHRFRLDSWETLCYLYRVNKTLWERKSLVVYTTASRSRNNKIDTVLSSNESIASIQRVTLK